MPHWTPETRKTNPLIFGLSNTFSTTRNLDKLTFTHIKKNISNLYSCPCSFVASGQLDSWQKDQKCTRLSSTSSAHLEIAVEYATTSGFKESWQHDAKSSAECRSVSFQTELMQWKEYWKLIHLNTTLTTRIVNGEHALSQTI